MANNRYKALGNNGVVSITGLSRKNPVNMAFDRQIAEFMVIYNQFGSSYIQFHSYSLGTLSHLVLSNV
jgi:predicted oxidoreductase